MTSLFNELKRRNVFRVGLAYVIGAWLVIQVADAILDNIGAPGWVFQTIMLVLALGFVAALFFAWAFEVTPEGLKRESEVDRSRSITHVTGRKLNRSITVLLVIALGYFIWESRIADRPSDVAESIEEASHAADTEVADDKSIAVLPFDNRSALAEDAYFTEGIHDDLLTTIAKIGSMKVISRTSVMQYHDTTKTIRDIAKELGVANILEGGVQRAGNQVRINVQLIDADTDEHLWAEIYDRELTAENLFVIQSEISKAIADALQATLSPEDKAKVEKVHTTNLEAYESYLIGRKRWTERTTESNADSIRHFQRAIDLDPTFALAYVGLGDAYRHEAFYGGKNPDDVFPLSKQAIDTAIQLDGSLGEAYSSRASLRHNLGDYAGAEADFKRALELSPNHLPTYNWYGLLLGSQGRYEEALEMLGRGLALDPLSIVLRSNMSTYYQVLGRFDDAKSAIDRIIELHPDASSGFNALAFYHAFVRNRFAEALIAASRSIAVDPADVNRVSLPGFMYLELGDIETAETWIYRQIELHPDDPSNNYNLLPLLMYRGENDDALLAAKDLYDYAAATDSYEWISLSLLRDADIASARYDNALQRYAALHPELVDADHPAVNRSNSYVVADIAYLLLQSGQKERADHLLKASEAVIAKKPLLGFLGSHFGNARTYALQGRTADSLAELRRGVDAGWRMAWQYHFDHDPIFETLRDEPEFRAMRAEVAADMVAQLERVRELEASGEILRPEDL